jgi:carboxyl-terminal processing protease
MLSSLDPHSAYLTGERYRELETNTRGSFGGIGITVTIKDGMLTVEGVMKDTPADKADIKEGDQIIKIDGEATSAMTLDGAVAKMRGARGSNVRVTLHRIGKDNPWTVSIVRDVIKIHSVDSRSIDGYAYIRLAQFQEGGDEEIEKRLARVTSPFLTAEIFGVEEIIDPRDTRPLLCEWVEGAYRMLPAELGPKARTCRP